MESYREEEMRKFEEKMEQHMRSHLRWSFWWMIFSITLICVCASVSIIASLHG